MAEAGSSVSVRSNAGRENADSPEEEAAADDAGLLQCLMQQETPTEEKNAELVAEAEAVAAGWMLDFLCLSLCRAFRDGRSEDFHRTRDSAEGECGPPGPAVRRGPETCFSAHTRAGSQARGRGFAQITRNQPLPVYWESSPRPHPFRVPQQYYEKPVGLHRRIKDKTG